MSKPTSVTVRVCACPAALPESPAAELLADDEDADDEDGDGDVEDDDAASLLPPQAVNSPRARTRLPAAATRRTWNTNTGPPGGPAAGAPDGSGPLTAILQCSKRFGKPAFL